MNQKGSRRRFGLRRKMNIMLIVSILCIAVGLMMITYRVYCDKVDSMYFEKAELITRVFADNIPGGHLVYLLDVIDTDEFKEARAEAEAAGDEEILRDWMRQQPPVFYEAEYYADADPLLDKDGDDIYTLYGNYKTILYELDDIKQMFGVESLYLQYYRDGVTYNIADPDESIMIIGTVEKPYEEFSKYAGNVYIPPTIYQYGKEWLLTSCLPIYDFDRNDDILSAGMVCVDINMNDVMRDRHRFLINSMVFIAMYILAAIVISVLMIHKMVIKPLKVLSDGAMGFGNGDEGFSMDDVIRLPIRTNDEIGDLYRQIQSMQERIVDSTDRLTRVTAERERVGTELRMATNIQKAMLPSNFPPFPDRREFDLYASMDPAKEVGGDFYDFFMIDDDHLCILIADVSDKGVPAALFMMSAKILIDYRAKMGGTPGEILTAVNAEMSRGNVSKMFVTVWMGILDVNTGVLTCSNAGHEYPFIRSGDGVFRMFRDKHDIMVAVMERAKYKNYELTLQPGDAIFVYTDGVPEANNAAGEMFGMKRLEDALNRLADQTPEGILQGVREDVDAFVDGAQQFDDLTMLCMEYRGVQP